MADKKKIPMPPFKCKTGILPFEAFENDAFAPVPDSVKNAYPKEFLDELNKKIDANYARAQEALAKKALAKDKK
jgi:hypothetical protein